MNLHRRSQRQQIQLDALNQKSKQQVLSINEQWQQAKITSLLYKNAAIPLLEALLEREPSHIAGEWVVKILSDNDKLGRAIRKVSSTAIYRYHF